MPLIIKTVPLIIVFVAGKRPLDFQRSKAGPSKGPSEGMIDLGDPDGDGSKAVRPGATAAWANFGTCQITGMGFIGMNL
jgi:hypothetical protein